MTDFEVIPSHVEEIIDSNWETSEVAQELAHQKAQDVFKQHPDSQVIGSDTVVRLGATIFGKPQDEEEARTMLKQLSGHIHLVETGVCILRPQGKPQLFTEQTRVFMKNLSPEEIEDYIQTKEPFGKAGSYAIQGHGALFIQKIEGCYNNVVGLPIFRLNQYLEQDSYERNRKSNALG